MRFLIRDRDSKYCAVPSTRCSERRAPRSSELRSGLHERTPSPSGGCARSGPSAWTGRSSAADDILSESFTPTTNHYNRARPHRGLELGTPEPGKPARRMGRRSGPVIRRDVLGGLINEYEVAA